MMKMVCVLALVLVVLGVGGIPLVKETPQAFCGRYLANARKVYCFGVTTVINKKETLNSSPLLDFLSSQEDSSGSTELVEEYFIQKRTDFPQSPIMPSVGVVGVDECCLRPCRMSELLNFC